MSVNAASTQTSHNAALQGRQLIGIDLGATNVRVARVAEDHVEQIQTEAIAEGEGPAAILNQIVRLIRAVGGEDADSIGIGVPSVVDVEKGIVYDVQNIPGWDEVPVKDYLEDRFNKPVAVNNDANCFVLGEWYFGKGRGYDSVVGLTLGSGFGSGLVLGGRLYSGANCGAGEVGMLPYKGTIFEHYCSGMFFERTFGIPGKKVYEKALEGDTDARIMYESFGRHMGNALKAVVYAYDPQLIILGGTIRKAYPYFKETMYAEMADFAYPKSLDTLELEISELEHVAVLGAAALPLDEQLLNNNSNL